MEVDPRTPVLVGAATETQRGDDPTRLAGAVELMERALRSAAADAGSGELLGAIDQVSVPLGSWAHSNPARMVADRVGATDARTALYEIGVLQQDLFDDACSRIASGELEVAAVVGGEARHRSVRARAAGVELVDPPDDGRPPDRTVAAASLGVHDLEIIRDAVTPATSYALIEHALAHAAGRTAAAEQGALGALWEGFARVAAENPRAWDRSAPSAEQITAVSPANRMISTPYTKLLCSQWNVDQSAALLLCSAGAARRWGVPVDRWVFPHASAVSNHAVAVLQRRELHRCVGAELAGPRVLEMAGLASAADLDHLDVYSCFPSAVQVLASALGVGPGRVLTVTGGLTFGGGPLNNYVLGALATMAPLLRSDPSARGLVTSVSGFLVKQGFGVWSATPPRGGWRHEDLTAEVGAHPDSAPLPVAGDWVGPARVASWTVVHEGGVPARAVAIADVDTPDGPARTLGSTRDAAVCSAMDSDDWVGRSIELEPDGAFSPT